jgi:2-methylisocitrate lyase-like PEP mutase family enzyme
VDPDRGVQAAADRAAGYQEAGADLVIMNLPYRPEPRMLGELAEALRPLT